NVTADSGRDFLRRGRAPDRGGREDADAAPQAARLCRDHRDDGRLHRNRSAAVAVAGGAAHFPAGFDRQPLRPDAEARCMNGGPNPIWSLASTFGLMSLFAVGGANAAIPEMHRIAVEVNHWMNDRQFADIYAISQLSPGPNVLIVTLIGYT